MRKYFLYLLIYSIGGFILERFLNLIFLGYYYDNSVLFGPWQPLYGFGILMAIIIYDLFLSKINHQFLKYFLLLIVSIITTGISEAVTGFGYLYLYDVSLWDYSQFFPCQIGFVCSIPTSMFGFFSFLVIVFIHPVIKNGMKILPKFTIKWIFRISLILFLIDVIYTFGFRLA